MLTRENLSNYSEVIKLNCSGSFCNGFFFPHNGNPALDYEVVAGTLLPVLRKDQATVTARYFDEQVSIHQDHLTYV